MVNITNEMLTQFQLSETEFRREMALWLFANRKISFGAARRLAELDTWQFQELLDDRNIPLHYDVDEYLTDLKNLHILPA